MTKKMFISVAAAAVLVTNFTGCAGGSPDTPIEHKVQDVSKVKTIKINIPINGIDDVNEKLKYLSQTYKLSIIAYNAVFASDNINQLVKNNAENIATLEEKLKGKSEQEVESLLVKGSNKLKNSAEYKRLQ